MPKKINFTKPAIAALPLPEPGKRDVYWDTKREGLQVRVTSNGTKTFSVYHRVKGGAPERITIGRFPKVSVEKARDDALQIVAKLVDGASAAQINRERKGEPTLEALFNDFIEHRRNRRGAYLTQSTKDDYQNRFEVHLAKFGSRKLSQIKNSDIVALHARLGRNHPTGANRVVALVSSLYGFAREQKVYMGPNPAAGIKKFAETARDRFLQADELPRFFQALAEDSSDLVRDYVLLSLLTGARKSNVLSMRWADLNLERGEWRIPVTKNGTSQTVPLGPEALDILKSRKPKDGTKEAAKAVYVLPSTGKRGYLAEPKTGWRRILDRANAIGIVQRLEAAGHGEKAKQLMVDTKSPAEAVEALTKLAARRKVNIHGTALENLRIHDLRRTLGSWQAKTGASLAIIGKSLHHKSTNTTAIYARLDLDPVRASVNQATGAIFAAAGLKDSAEVVALKKANKK